MSNRTVSTVIKILFVCFGNICRSPAAEGIMLHILKEKNILNKAEVDSCGTHAYSEGGSPDDRMMNALGNRGIELNHITRQCTEEDIDYFDLIITMDHENYNYMKDFGTPKKKLFQMIDFVENKRGKNEIPDPYYGWEDGFILVIDLVYEGCLGILKYLDLI